MRKEKVEDCEAHQYSSLQFSPITSIFLPRVSLMHKCTTVFNHWGTNTGKIHVFWDGTVGINSYSSCGMVDYCHG